MNLTLIVIGIILIFIGHPILGIIVLLEGVL
jgi:hypothetical protein